MQLIDTDTDIDFQTKMSTMQQESIEKFSLIENVRSDITNRNDECVNNEVVEDVCVNNTEANEQTTQHMKSCQDPILNNKRNEECNEHTALFDEETVENKKNSESVDVQSVENKHEVQEKENDEIAIKLNTLADKETIEMLVSNGNNSKNESKAINTTNKDIEQNCDTEYHKVNQQNNIIMDVTFEGQDISNNLTKNKIENKVKDVCEIDGKNEGHKKEDVEMDITFHEDDKRNNILKENTIEDGVTENSKVQENNELRNKGDIEMEVTFYEEHKENNNLTEDIIEDDVDENIEIDDKIQKQNDIEMDVNYEDDKVNKSLTEDKIKEGENSNNIEKQNQEDIEMDTSFEEVIESVIDDKMEKVKNKYEQLHNDISEKHVHLDLIETKVQDNVDNSAMEKYLEKEASSSSSLNFEKEGSEMSEKVNDLEDLKVIEMKNIINNIAIIEEQVERTIVINDSQIQQNNKNLEMNVTIELPNKENNGLTECKNNTEITTTLETFHGKKEDTLKELKEIGIRGNLEEHDNNKISRERFEGKVNMSTEILSKPVQLFKDKSEIHDQLQEKSKENRMASFTREDHANKEMDIKRKLEITHNEVGNEIVEKTLEQDKKESVVDDKSKELDQTDSQTEDKISEEQSKLDNNLQALLIESEEHIDENPDATKKDSSCITANIDKQSENSNQNPQEKHKDGSKNIQGIPKTTKEEEKTIIDEDSNQKVHDIDEDKNTNTIINNNKTKDTEMDIDELVDIADEKGDVLEQSMGTIDKESQNEEKTSGEISKTLLLESTGTADILLNPAIDSPDHDTNDPKINLKKSTTEKVEKTKLIHISKLSNTLDILSDEEEDLIKIEPQNNNSDPNEEQCTSINLDDDDDIMLIDEELKPNDHENETESLAEPESNVLSKAECKVESKDDDEESWNVCETIKDTIKTEVTGVDVIKTNESDEEEIQQEDSPIQKKPVVPVNFLNKCLKNLAGMTRDDLEEFCVLKIVEGVVDRSNLSEIKSQLKTVTQHVDEYKKKIGILVKQNRDLQVVLKTVQEEQKKKSNTPIIPLKITRSVGMQVFMTDKVAVRKKIVTGQTNAATNSGTNRKGAQSKIQKISPSTNNSPIPVPRLVPAVNTGNSNNVKIQSPNANTAGKTHVTGPVNSPTQTVPNGLPATTPPAQKPEKRPLIRMQQSNSFTVDLTDDEPPTKVASRNITPPVRLVPPQNLLAPNRQPFGANVSNPRKVYIPISGSQTPVGVKPGQTIMLKTIGQSARQRLSTPSPVKSNHAPNTVRMQRVPSRHPAPLPDSVKQYQPLNWKALPPAPDLKLSKVDNGIVISWKIDGYLEENYEEIASYQLFAYQETSSPPSTALWKKIGDVKALPLPMACTLTQFMAGFKYYFAVRAVDIRSRLGPFSLPGSILLLNKL